MISHLTPILWGFYTSFFVEAPFFTSGAYIVATGIYNAINPPPPSDAWYHNIRILYCIGATFCGLVLRLYLRKYWSGYRQASFRWREGVNRVSTVVTILTIVGFAGMLCLHELAVRPYIFAFYDPNFDVATKSWNMFLWEGLGLYGFLTVLQGGCALVLYLYSTEFTDLNVRSVFIWKYLIGIPLLWMMYGISFTRYVTGYVSADGIDWIPMGLCLAGVAFYTMVSVMIAGVWRESVKGDSNMERIVTTHSVNYREKGTRKE